MKAFPENRLEKCLAFSAPTVTRVVEELRWEGLVCEEGTEQTHMGRRPVGACVKERLPCRRNEFKQDRGFTTVSETWRRTGAFR